MRGRKFKGHTNVINSVDVSKKGTELLVSGSDDNTFKLWDPRVKKYLANYEVNY